MGEREMTTAGPPAPSGEQQRSTKRILSTASSFFFFFGAEEQPLELPVQSKLRLEVTQKERLVRHFPNYHQKKFFFSPLFKGTSLQLPKQRPKQRPFQKEQKKKKKTFVSCTQFTVPEWLQKCSFFPLFYLSLIKLFLNFCSRYFLRNGMCGQAKLPGPEVKLRKIYSRHPLDFS